jgi:hypothetical protein
VRWVLVGAGRGVPRDQGAAPLVPQDRERALGIAEVRASGREDGAGRDLERRGQAARLRRGDGVRGALPGEVPKAVKKITDDVAALLAFYDFPAGHWIHLRTTNPGVGVLHVAPATFYSSASNRSSGIPGGVG